MDRWRPEDGRSWYFWLICCAAIVLGALFAGTVIGPLVVDAGSNVYESISADVQRMVESIGL